MDEPAEKSGLRNAWGRVAEIYEDTWPARTAHFTARGLDLLDPPAGSSGVDVACGPGVTTVALADRLGGGQALGVDFAPAMVAHASALHADRDDVAFAVDDAENLSLAPGSADVLTCAFGLMYCYDARAAMASMARTLRPGGRMLQVVWGPAPTVWWVPVIELIESRAAYFSAVCPLMFFYGLPGVMPRMVGEAGLTLAEHVTMPGSMAFSGVPEAVEAAIVSLPLAGLFANRLDARAQGEVREALAAHVEGLARPDGNGGITLPAEVALVVSERPVTG